jgi:DNA adenine methylase
MSLIPYIGEKSLISNFIISEIPLDIKTYVEPFGGAFGVYLSINLERFKDVKFVYNDINHCNHNLFLKLREPSFIKTIKRTFVDENLYEKSLSNLNTNDSDLLAISWLIVLCCSNIKDVGKYSWIGTKKFDLFKIKIRFYDDHLSSIDSLHNLDYKEIIDMYDSSDTFFYLDPPYKGTEDYYINHNFNIDSHKELADVLNKIQGRFALSYYLFDELPELYPNCRFISKKTIGTEWLIMNY